MGSISWTTSKACPHKSCAVMMHILKGLRCKCMMRPPRPFSVGASPEAALRYTSKFELRAIPLSPASLFMRLYDSNILLPSFKFNVPVSFALQWLHSTSDWSRSLTLTLISLLLLLLLSPFPVSVAAASSRGNARSRSTMQVFKARVVDEDMPAVRFKHLTQHTVGTFCVEHSAVRFMWAQGTMVALGCIVLRGWGEGEFML